MLVSKSIHELLRVSIGVNGEIQRYATLDSKSNKLVRNPQLVQVKVSLMLLSEELRQPKVL